MSEKRRTVEFIESYIKIGNSDYQWDDNHGELIRCKDCKYWEEHYKWVRPEGGSYIAPRCNQLMKKSCSNWFCADGERK